MGSRISKYIGGLVAGIVIILAAENLATSDAHTPAPPIVTTPKTEPLVEYAKRSIEVSSPKVSPGRRALTANMISHIAEDIFTERAHQEFWIALLGVESRYESSARSPVGAVGLGQLMPAYMKDFGKDCDLTEVTEHDAFDDYSNAYLSACYFRTLIAANGNSIPLALVSYNAGINSNSLKQVKNGGSPVQEAAAYTTKVWAKKDQTNKPKEEKRD